MDWPLFLFTLFGLQILCLGVSRCVSRQMETPQDYFLAGRQVHLFPLTMTLVATQIGGGLVLGTAQESYQHGWSVLVYPLGQAMGFILLAAGIGSKMAEAKVSTVAELFEKSFHSTWLRKGASLLSILSLFMIFIGQLVASNKFMISLGLTETWVFLLFWGVVIAYTVLGGLKAVIATDVVQALFFLIIFLLALLLHTTPTSLQEVPFSSETGALMTGWLVLPMLFACIGQDMGQRCFAADSPRTITRAAYSAALITFFTGLVPVYFGILAHRASLTIPEGGSVFMAAMEQLTNPFVTALAACAVIAAIVSTADSLLNAISSNLTQDFRWPLRPLLAARIATTIIALSGLWASFYLENILGILLQSYELSLSMLFVPVMVALFQKQTPDAPHMKIQRMSIWAACLAGGFSFFTLKYLPSSAIPKELLSLAISGTTYLVSRYLGLKSNVR